MSACFFFLGILFCLPAQAQYGGSGWVAMPNTNQGTAQNPIWDWTGLDGSLIWVNYDGTSDSRTGKSYGSWGVFTSTFTGLQEIGGAAPDFASATAKVSGSSTYKWQWTPPNGDTHNYPSQPLYVLADITGLCSCSGGVGLSGWGNISDGPHPAASFSSTPGQVSLGTNGVSRLLMHASGSPATLTLSPSENSKLSGTASGDSGVMIVQLSESAFPVLLSSPSPLGRPDLGDGSNQFVYDATTPNGYLNFSGSISVSGGSAADTAWLMRDPKASAPRVALTLDLPAETVSQGWALWDHTLLPSVPDISLLVKYGSPPNLSDGFCYAGLPNNNSGFGGIAPQGGGSAPNYHLVTLTVNSNNSQSAHIQTFFTSTASNYPGASSDMTTNGFATPNWYHYYKQVYNPATGSTTATYDNQALPSNCDLAQPHAIHIRDDAFANTQMRVFTLLSKSNPASLIKYAGYIEIPQGIWPYTTIIAHEKGHYDAWQNHIYASNVSLDNDNDGVDDQWEPLHHLLNTTDDTTGAYISLNINGDTPDNEVIADIPALGTLFANKAFWKLDWAGVWSEPL